MNQIIKRTHKSFVVMLMLVFISVNHASFAWAQNFNGDKSENDFLSEAPPEGEEQEFVEGAVSPEGEGREFVEGAAQSEGDNNKEEIAIDAVEMRELQRGMAEIAREDPALYREMAQVMVQEIELVIQEPERNHEGPGERNRPADMNISTQEGQKEALGQLDAHTGEMLKAGMGEGDIAKMKDAIASGDQGQMEAMMKEMAGKMGPGDMGPGGPGGPENFGPGQPGDFGSGGFDMTQGGAPMGEMMEMFQDMGMGPMGPGGPDGPMMDDGPMMMEMSDFFQGVQMESMGMEMASHGMDEGAIQEMMEHGMEMIAQGQGQEAFGEVMQMAMEFSARGPMGPGGPEGPGGSEMGMGPRPVGGEGPMGAGSPGEFGPMEGFQGQGGPGEFGPGDFGPGGPGDFMAGASEGFDMKGFAQAMGFDPSAMEGHFGPGPEGGEFGPGEHQEFGPGEFFGPQGVGELAFGPAGEFGPGPGGEFVGPDGFIPEGGEFFNPDGQEIFNSESNDFFEANENYFDPDNNLPPPAIVNATLDEQFAFALNEAKECASLVGIVAELQGDGGSIVDNGDSSAPQSRYQVDYASNMGQIEALFNSLDANIEAEQDRLERICDKAAELSSSIQEACNHGIHPGHNH